MNIYKCGGQSMAAISNIIYKKLGIKNIKDITWDDNGIFYYMKDGTMERVGLFSQFIKEMAPNIQKINHEKI